MTRDMPQVRLEDMHDHLTKVLGLTEEEVNLFMEDNGPMVGYLGHLKRKKDFKDVINYMKLNSRITFDFVFKQTPQEYHSDMIQLFDEIVADGSVSHSSDLAKRVMKLPEIDRILHLNSKEQVLFQTYLLRMLWLQYGKSV